MTTKKLQRQNEHEQMQKQRQVLRLAALAQDDFFLFWLREYFLFSFDCAHKKVEAATGAASASMLG
jgi:hypothetical protein